MQNGNLILPPFRAEDYNQEVHAQTYRCIAENTFGKIQSRDVHVRAGTADFIFLFGGKLFATGCPFVNTKREFFCFLTIFLLMPLSFKKQIGVASTYINITRCQSCSLHKDKADKLFKN